VTLLDPTSIADPCREETAPSPYAWFVVAILWFVAMLNYLDRLMITTMRDPIRADISITDAQFGLLTSVFLWVYAFVSPFGGYVADRFTRRGVIAGSLLFWSAATFLTGFAQTFHQLLWARALMGISEACYLPAALALICDYHRGSTRSFATGLHMSGLSVGAALGGIGGYLAEHIGWRAGFERLGIAGFAYGLVVLFTLRDASAAGALAGGFCSRGEVSAGEGAGGTEEIASSSPTVLRAAQTMVCDELENSLEGGRPRPPFSSGQRRTRTSALQKIPKLDADPATPAQGALSWLLAKPAFQILFLVNILIGMSNWTMYTWMPTYLREHFRLGLGAAGLSATGYVQAASFAGVFIFGFSADRWSRTNRRARSLTPAWSYLIAGPCLFAAASTHSLPLAIAGLIVFGLARGAFDANHMPILRQIATDRYSATAFGIVNMISCVAGGVMVYIGGALSDAHVSLARIFQVCGVALAIVGLLLMTIGQGSGKDKLRCQRGI